MLKAIVTAGGLSEPIDNVRAITNFSTGKLGALIAEEFLKQGVDVTYVCSDSAMLPDTEVSNRSDIYRQVTVNTTRELFETVQSLLKSNKYSFFVHSMAVSDYEVKSIEPELISGKMASNLEEVVIKLSPTPKVIGEIKKIHPDVKLVGFKLLANTSIESLIEIAGKLSRKNSCEFVIANRKEDITATEHKAFFVSSTSEIIQQFNSKQDIAKGCVSLLLYRLI